LEIAMTTNLLASHRRNAGFTLVETVIATSIAGVLASVAYPSVAAALQKVRRSEALVAMMQLQQAEERWRSGSARYATLAELGLPTTATGGHYRLTVTDATGSGYVAIAEAIGAQSGDRRCRYLKLAIDAGNPSYRSGETDTTDNGTAANRQCWNL
jgi:type IV pilus assembly protein PilE